MSTPKELSWEEFASLCFAERDIHFTDKNNKPTRGTIVKMELVYAGVPGFVFVVQTRKGIEKFVISTFLNLDQPQQFENGRVKATNMDGTHCVIYFDDEKESFAV